MPADGHWSRINTERLRLLGKQNAARNKSSLDLDPQQSFQTSNSTTEKQQDFNYETPTVDQRKKTMFIELSVSPFTIPFLSPLSARRLNWLSSSLKAVRIKAHSRATTARSSAAVLHARMLRINSRSLIDMAPRFHPARGPVAFLPPKKTTKVWTTPRWCLWFLLEHICHVMSCLCFLGFVVVQLGNGRPNFCQWHGLELVAMESLKVLSHCGSVETVQLYARKIIRTLNHTKSIRCHDSLLSWVAHGLMAVLFVGKPKWYGCDSGWVPYWRNWHLMPCRLHGLPYTTRHTSWDMSKLFIFRTHCQQKNQPLKTNTSHQSLFGEITLQKQQTPPWPIMPWVHSDDFYRRVSLQSCDITLWQWEAPVSIALGKLSLLSYSNRFRGVVHCHRYTPKTWRMAHILRLPCANIMLVANVQYRTVCSRYWLKKVLCI